MQDVPTDGPAPSESKKNGGRRWFTALAALWLAGLALNLVLAVESGRLAGENQGGLPGCGGKGFDCRTVLNSPYSRVAGASLTTWAFGYYLIAAGAWAAAWRGATKGPPALTLAPAVWAATAAAAAGWSGAVMIVKLNTLCPYCAALHGVNLLYFFLAVGLAQKMVQREKPTADEPSRLKKPALAAVVVGLVVAAWQLAFLGMFHERPNLTWAEAQTPPTIGSPQDAGPTIWTIQGPRDAQNAAVLFSCFTCPNCKHAHELLRELQAGGEGELGGEAIRIDLRLNPLAAPCNPYFTVQGTALEHKYACRIAQTAVAVAEVDPTAFPSFADWLYENQGKINAFDAEKEARTRVEPKRLAEALDPATESGRKVEQRLKADMDLSLRLKLDKVPQVYLAQSGSNQPGRRLSGYLNKEQLGQAFREVFQPGPVEPASVERSADEGEKAEQ